MRHGIEVDYCPNDHGMWLDLQELDQLEDKVFSDDHEKGTLVFSSTASDLHCPKCGGQLKQFQYRLDDLTLDYCEKDGYWLDSGEDERVLQLMKERRSEIQRKLEAESEWKDAEHNELDPEAEWKLTLLKLRSRQFLKKFTDLFH
jgi:Zn-finger nucleic acid-binding protein